MCSVIVLKRKFIFLKMEISIVANEKMKDCKYIGNGWWLLNFNLFFLSQNCKRGTCSFCEDRHREHQSINCLVEKEKNHNWKSSRDLKILSTYAPVLRNLNNPTNDILAKFHKRSQTELKFSGDMVKSHFSTKFGVNGFYEKTLLQMPDTPVTVIDLLTRLSRAKTVWRNDLNILKHLWGKVGVDPAYCSHVNAVKALDASQESLVCQLPTKSLYVIG